MDFGSPLPFNYVPHRTDQTWCVYYCRLANEEEARSKAPGDAEMWGYFVWLPRDSSQNLGEPDFWGYTDEVPHEHIFARVRRQPMYMVCQIEADLAQTGRSFYRRVSAWPLSAYWTPWSSRLE